MQLLWDEQKRRANVRKHGLDFVGLEEVFDGHTVTAEDVREDYGERRFVTIGLLQGRLVTIVHTESTKEIRVISVRKATRYEERNYFSRIRD